MDEINIDELTLFENATIRDAITCLEATEKKIVIIKDYNNKFKGTVCDGDIRRGVLRGLDLNANILTVMETNPIVVGPEIEYSLVRKLMRINNLQQIPVIDSNHYFIDLYSWNAGPLKKKKDNFFIIMAGGRGKRMLSETDDCPKPMLLIQGKPMLEHIIENAKEEGFIHFIISVNYLGSQIKEYFGDGKRMDINIQYLNEEQPLGTAGALSLLDEIPENPFLVSNGDIISKIMYSEMLEYHKKNHAFATMAVRPYEMQNPFGVVELNGLNIINCIEKPVIKSYINAGVYVLNPDVLKLLEYDKPCDMVTLFQIFKEKNIKNIAYPLHEDWADVGKPDDLKMMNEIKK